MKFTNAYEVLEHLGKNSGMFKLVEDEMVRLKNENTELKGVIDDLNDVIVDGDKEAKARLKKRKQAKKSKQSCVTVG